MGRALVPCSLPFRGSRPTRGQTKPNCRCRVPGYGFEKDVGLRRQKLSKPTHPTGLAWICDIPRFPQAIQRPCSRGGLEEAAATPLDRKEGAQMEKE